MGVYVKDATAPKNCTGCIAVHYYVSMAGDAGMLCEVTGLSMDDYYSDGRPDWCPLIEVPEPHGRLIDADALRAKMYHEAFETDTPMQKWDSGCWIRYKMFEDMEESAPTIIPAESESDDRWSLMD